MVTGDLDHSCLYGIVKFGVDRFKRSHRRGTGDSANREFLAMLSHSWKGILLKKKKMGELKLKHWVIQSQNSLKGLRKTGRQVR